MIMVVIGSLGQADGISRAIVWSLVLIVVVLVLFAAVVMIKRWLRKPEDLMPGGFTLGDLRDLHRRGEMTDDEFERARAQIVESTRKAAVRDRVEEKPRRDRLV
jgi:uncharacterized membrane protein